MAIASSLSDQLRDAAAAERALVSDRVAELRDQARRMHELAAAVDEDLAANLRLLGQLDEMLGIAPQLSMTEADDALRGQRLRNVAIQILKKALDELLRTIDREDPSGGDKPSLHRAAQRARAPLTAREPRQDTAKRERYYRAGKRMQHLEVAVPGVCQPGVRLIAERQQIPQLINSQHRPGD